MNYKIIWITALVFATVHFAISMLALVSTAIISDRPEWGLPLSVYLTTFPLAEAYDWLLDRPGVPLIVELGVPLIVGTLVYAAVGAVAGYCMVRIRRNKALN